MALVAAKAAAANPPFAPTPERAISARRADVQV
jgi:hypothetical protein